MRGFVGYGELGRQIDALVTAVEGPCQAWYFDDLLCRGGDAPNTQPFDAYSEDRFAECSFYVCLGYKQLPKRAEAIEVLANARRRLPVLRHPSAQVAASAHLDLGAVVYPLVNIDKDVVIGRGALLNNSVVVSHNSRIGECSYLSPGVVLSGYVTVGARTFMGSGAVVADRVAIGDDAVIGIGTVVTRDVPSGASVIGNPMRVLSQRLRL
jgi:sugar O-acyltransferase (sialic acid O-acetyltransferase NeuD family)